MATAHAEPYAGIVQGSEDWYRIRCGKITASHIDEVMAQGKGGAPSIGRTKYMTQLACELLTGKPYPESFKSAAMARGNDAESGGIARYEVITGRIVTRVPFVDHPSIAGAGASPDALVDDDGLLEQKNPDSHTHLAYLFGAPIDRPYRLQMQWQLACTGRQWCDWMTHDDRMPDWLTHKVVRFPRDEILIADITRAVLLFRRELLALVERMEGLRHGYE